MRPSVSHTERIASRDDVLPLRFPVKSVDGEDITSIRIKKGQVIYVPTIAINTNATVSRPRLYLWLNLSNNGTGLGP